MAEIGWSLKGKGA